MKGLSVLRLILRVYLACVGPVINAFTFPACIPVYKEYLTHCSIFIGLVATPFTRGML